MYYDEQGKTLKTASSADSKKDLDKPQRPNSLQVNHWYCKLQFFALVICKQN